MQVVGMIAPATLGYQSFALLGLQTRGPLAPTLQRLAAIPEVDYLVHATGSADVLAEVVCRDDVHLAATVGRIRAMPEVAGALTFSYLAVAKWPASGARHRRHEAHDPAVAKLDDVDRQLLRLLQQDGRASFQELATATKQPYAIARRRALRLFDTGVVEAVAVVNRLAIGQRLMAGIGLRTEGPLAPLLRAIVALPEVEVTVVTTGAFDVLLEVACRDKSHLAELVGDRLRAISGVRGSETFTYLDIVKLPMTWSVPNPR